MISMEDYLDLLGTHQQIVNHLMEQAKEEAVNEEFLPRKMAKTLRKDMIKRTNEAIDIVNGNFKLEKKGNYAVKLSDKYDKMPKSVYKKMTKLTRLQSSVNGYIAETSKSGTIEENKQNNDQQATAEPNKEQSNAEVQEQSNITPAKEPDAIEGQMDIEELNKGGNNES